MAFCVLSAGSRSFAVSFRKHPFCFRAHLRFHQLFGTAGPWTFTEDFLYVFGKDHFSLHEQLRQLGVSFGMARSEVKALLGEPAYDNGSYYEWHVEVPDIAYEGTLSMYFTEDADTAGVSQVDLTVFEK